MDAKQRYVILSPTLSAPEGKGKLAPRIDTLDGKVVGFLGNGFEFAKEALEEAERLLKLDYELKGVVRFTKSYIGEPATPAILEELVNSCDLVITAIGA